MDYAVQFGENNVGKVQVTRQGLYYRMICRCQLTGEVMCRLEVICGTRHTNLGILVPKDNGFGLETKVSVSRVGEGELSFCILPRHDSMTGRIFVPIKPEEPFAYLSRLKEAFLEIRGTQKGISIPEDQSK